MVLYKSWQSTNGGLSLCFKRVAAQRSSKILIFPADIWLCVYRNSTVSNLMWRYDASPLSAYLLPAFLSRALLVGRCCTFFCIMPRTLIEFVVQIVSSCIFLTHAPSRMYYLENQPRCMWIIVVLLHWTSSNLLHYYYYYYLIQFIVLWGRRPYVGHFSSYAFPLYMFGGIVLLYCVFERILPTPSGRTMQVSTKGRLQQEG